MPGSVTDQFDTGNGGLGAVLIKLAIINRKSGPTLSNLGKHHLLATKTRNAYVPRLRNGKCWSAETI